MPRVQPISNVVNDIREGQKADFIIIAETRNVSHAISDVDSLSTLPLFSINVTIDHEKNAIAHLATTALQRPSAMFC